ALTDSGAATDVGQGVDKAIDGTGDKYYNRSHYGGAFGGSGLVVTPSVGATVVTGLSLTSGDDSPNRDPTSFSLFGSNDTGKTFTPIAVGQAIPAFTERHQNQRLAVANAKPYTTYKLIFPTVAGGPDMQVEEADLLGDLPPGMKPPKPLPPPAGMTLWYTRPAASGMNEALPIGNSRLGGLIYGGVAQERLALNEDSLWTGGDNPSGNYDTMGAYQLLGDLHLALPGHAQFTRYQRDLDIGQALAHVEYQSGGVTFHREYFASHPGQVLVARLTADKPGAYTGTLDLADAHGSASTVHGNTITFTGKLPNGMQYETQARLLAEGGTVTAADGKLRFSHCDNLTVLVAAGTSYVMDYAKH
ncbi:MAG: glycoside hydrolase family 95 protein, partial [Armatimonadota bacterium]|nr:glycoside hydrolase family 95 protein [Armatimonadota bacterium]